VEAEDEQGGDRPQPVQVSPVRHPRIKAEPGPAVKA
jgi:hypothetical protein